MHFTVLLHDAVFVSRTKIKLNCNTYFLLICISVKVEMSVVPKNIVFCKVQKDPIMKLLDLQKSELCVIGRHHSHSTVLRAVIIFEEIGLYPCYRMLVLF